MELLEGEPLFSRLQKGPLSPRRAVDLAVQAAHGLAAAHEKGIVHRDLKPGNLWVTKDERLRILDFGLAKKVQALRPASDSAMETEEKTSDHETGQGIVVGTLGYMSPEQVRGEPVDGRTDIFSFGAVLYEMLTGRRAFARPTAADTMAAILKEEPPEIEETGKPVPLGLRRIVDRCLEKSASRRFQTAHDLAFALENALGASGAAGGKAAAMGALRPLLRRISSGRAPSFSSAFPPLPGPSSGRAGSTRRASRSSDVRLDVRDATDVPHAVPRTAGGFGVAHARIPSGRSFVTPIPGS